MAVDTGSFKKILSTMKRFGNDAAKCFLGTRSPNFVLLKMCPSLLDDGCMCILIHDTFLCQRCLFYCGHDF